MTGISKISQTLAATMVAVIVMTAGAFAQGEDTAYVPFIVNVDATVMARQNDTATAVSMTVIGGQAKILKLPLGDVSSVRNTRGASKRLNSPAITGSRGNITIRLPAQSYKNAEFAVYSINGRRILRGKADAEKAAGISRRNVASGIYIVSAKGINGNSFTSRVTHNGGNLSVNVAFGSENSSLRKAAAAGAEWEITVSATGYDDSTYAFSAVKGTDNPAQNITLQRTSQGVSALRAEPVATPKSNWILDSWTDGEKNWYVIDVGYISNTLVMKTEIVRYSGIGTITLSVMESIETSLTKSRTETVSNSIVVSESSTNTTSIENSTTWKGAGSVDILKIFTVESGLEKTITNSSAISRTVEVSYEKSKETSESFMTSLTKSSAKSLSFTIDRVDPTGHYRYAWYVVNDVYFIISTSSNNQDLLSWDIVSCPRGDISGGLELSTDGKFDNSPITGNEIVLADDFYKTLPIPTDTILPPPPKLIIETKEITSSGAYTFDKGFPATIEVYALGGGGGGQGGHWWVLGNGNIFGGANGTGGSGGGGGAAYMKLVVEEPATMNITIGTGGNGGGGENNVLPSHWYAGYSGGNGNSTTVTLEGESIILTANGGIGGGHNRTGPGSGNSAGGPGGSATARPVSSLVIDWDSTAGNNGSNGTDWGCVTGGKGGNAATLSIGSASFAGGSGGNSGCKGGSNSGNNGGGGGGGWSDNNSGGRGGNGKVLIVTTYYE